MAYAGGQYTLTATAATLTAALGLTAKLHCKQIIVRGKVGNAQPIYLGPSTVTNVPANAREQVAAGGTSVIGPFPTNSINTDEVYIVGTAADVAHITVVT